MKKITGWSGDDEEDNMMVRVRLVTGGVMIHYCAAECSCVRASSRAIHDKQQSSTALVSSAAAGRQSTALCVNFEKDHGLLFHRIKKVCSMVSCLTK